MSTVHVESGPGPYAQIVSAREHRLTVDEGRDLGGEDSGPTPSELLLGALASCVAITLKMYAGRKGWDLRHVSVDVSGRDDNGVYVIDRALTLTGELTAEQRERLTDIAGKCPVSKRLMGPVEIRPRP
jgi:putative redox protein